MLARVPQIQLLSSQIQKLERGEMEKDDRETMEERFLLQICSSRTMTPY